MGKLKLLLLCLITFLVTGCKEVTPMYKGLTVVSEDYELDGAHILVMTDFSCNYMYNVATGELIRKSLVVNDVKPALYLLEYEGCNLIKIRPITYACTYNDVCGLYSRLLDEGFSVIKLKRDSSYLDMVLMRDKEGVRIIYSGKDEVKILSKNFNFEKFLLHI